MIWICFHDSIISNISKMFVSVNPRFFLLTFPKHRWIETPWCFHIRLCGSACLIYLDNEFPIQIVADCCMLFEFGSFLVMIPLIIYVYTVVVYSILCIYIYFYQIVFLLHRWYFLWSVPGLNPKVDFLQFLWLVIHIPTPEHKCHGM